MTDKQTVPLEVRPNTLCDQRVPNALRRRAGPGLAGKRALPAQAGRRVPAGPIP